MSSTPLAEASFAARPSPSVRTEEPSGEMTFMSGEAQLQRTAELLGDGFLVVHVPPLPMSLRGHLADHIDEHIERELAARGAPSPYLSAWSALPDDAAARISEQLFRAKSVTSTGLAIAMSSLASAARGSALTPEDSATLRMLARAAADSPVVVLVDDGDAWLGAYAEPVSLASLLEVKAPRLTPIIVMPDPVEVAPPTEVEPTAMLVAETVEVVDAVEVVESVEVTEVVEPEVVVAAPVIIAPVEMPPLPTIEIPPEQYRPWVAALTAARGPQALTSFEKLFVECYVPLSNAIANGLDDPRALRAHDEFRTSFERAYSDAFATFGATNRRPRLVMDAHEVAMKHARLHNARSAHVLFVDSMRYDLGGLVRDVLSARAGGVASLTGEGLLFAALPTTTIRQLETVARGVDALRSPGETEAPDSLRGKSAEAVRRMRVGSRELYKLDIVPAMLETDASFEEIAEATAASIARHVATLPPRTLLLVVGDHGFTVDKKGQILSGGASPEEVMVPAFSYLVGELH